MRDVHDDQYGGGDWNRRSDGRLAGIKDPCIPDHPDDHFTGRPAELCHNGTGATGMSPFSQGGAMAITGCKDEAVRESLWSKQLLFAFLFLLFYIVCGFLGVFNLIAGIF